MKMVIFHGYVKLPEGTRWIWYAPYWMMVIALRQFPRKDDRGKVGIVLLVIIVGCTKALCFRIDGPGIFRCIKLRKIMVEYSNNPENRKFVYINTLLYVLAGFCFSIFGPWVFDILFCHRWGYRLAS